MRVSELRRLLEGYDDQNAIVTVFDVGGSAERYLTALAPFAIDGDAMLCLIGGDNADLYRPDGTDREVTR